MRYLGQVAKDRLPAGMLGLRNANALCPHPNIANAAQAIGFGKVFTSEAGDEALMKATIAWLTL